MLDHELILKACAFELFADHVFLDRQLLFDAVVSKGYPNEHPDLKPVYRQALLANLGDTVIDLLATESLLRERHIMDAAELSKRRERMVKGTSLNELAAAVIPFLAMTRGEERELHHSSTPGESLEALVGALYLDGGLPAARGLLTKLGFFDKKY
jgi:ribonuclease III